MVIKVKVELLTDQSKPQLIQMQNDNDTVEVRHDGNGAPSRVRRGFRVLQDFPPVVEAELQTLCFLSSIFMDWLSAQDSLDTEDTPRTALLPGFRPRDSGMRVELLLGCTSEHDWRECREDH